MTLDADTGVPARHPDERPFLPLGGGEILTYDAPWDVDKTEFERGVRVATEHSLLIERSLHAHYRQALSDRGKKAYHEGYCAGRREGIGTRRRWFLLIVLAAVIFLVPFLLAGQSQAGTPTPQLTALQYQEQQINTLKGDVAVLKHFAKCLDGNALGVVQIEGVDGTPWLAQGDDSVSVYLPVLKKRCLV